MWVIVRVEGLGFTGHNDLSCCFLNAALETRVMYDIIASQFFPAVCCWAIRALRLLLVVGKAESEVLGFHPLVWCAYQLQLKIVTTLIKYNIIFWGSDNF